MKKKLIIVVLALTTSLYAVDGKSLLIGIGIGLGIYYKPVKNSVLMPVARKIQRTVRPIPQDKIEAQQKKETKRKAKLEKQEKSNGRL